MPVLPEQPIPLRFTRLGGDVDPKSGAKGQCELLENTQSLRLEDGGVQIEKRPGTPSLSTSILGGGSISAGAKVAVLGDELVMTDGHRLYSRASTSAVWVPRGRACDLAASVARIPGGSIANGNQNIDCDVAYADGYACYVVSTSEVLNPNGQAAYYIVEVATDTVLASGSLTAPAFNLRVVAIASAFYLFAWDSVNTLTAYKITTAAPTVLSAGAAVAVNLNTGGVFDVIADVTNTRMVVGYRNTTPTLTLKIWNTNQTAGTTVAYATRDPNRCAGFLDHTFADGNGYLAIGTSATGMRVLTFGASSMTVTVDTQVDAAETDARAVTGYFSTVLNVFYTRPHATLTYHDKISGWSNGTAFTVMRSVSVAGRAFSISGKRYLLAAYDGGTGTVTAQRSLFLLELDVDATAQSQVSVAGSLVAGNAGRRARTYRSVGGVAIVSATAALTAFPLEDFPPPAGAFDAHFRFAMARATLDWAGTLTGAPVAFNGGLYVPGAGPKLFDGLTVTEPGFLVFPEPPVLVASNGGSLTLLATYQYCCVYTKVYASGRLEQSAPSDVVSVTLTGTQATIAVTVPHLRVTEWADTAFNPNPAALQVRADVYRRVAGGEFRLRSVIYSSMTADSTTLNDSSADTLIASDEGLYTDNGAVDNIWPPAVSSYCVHRNRLFAVSGDGAVWFTKESGEGDAASFSDSFRVLFDDSDGPLTGLISLDATLAATKRSSVWAITGEGPLPDGENPYPFPVPLPGSTGLVSPRAFVVAPDGALIATPKGKSNLDRAGGIQPIPGTDAYDSLTVTGGVILSDRPMALLTTLEGRTLCWDWLLKTWHTWTGQPAVAACLWQNKFVWLESNGKVHVETPGAFADDAGAYSMVAQLSWVDMVHAYLKRIEVIGEAFGTCTLTALSSYDYDEANVDTSRSWALAVAGPKSPWILEPDQGYCEAYNLKLTETSTTQGVKLSKLVAWVGLLPGSHKHAPSQYAT